MRKVKPAEVKAEVGKTYKLRCNSHKPPLWYYSNTEDLPKDVQPLHDSKNLELSEVQFKDSGYYSCYGGIGIKGLRTHFWSTAVVKVYGRHYFHFSNFPINVPPLI